jgi:hypothetical protein
VVPELGVDEQAQGAELEDGAPGTLRLGVLEREADVAEELEGRPHVAVAEVHPEVEVFFRLVCLGRGALQRRHALREPRVLALGLRPARFLPDLPRRARERARAQEEHGADPRRCPEATPLPSPLTLHRWRHRNPLARGARGRGRAICA